MKNYTMEKPMSLASAMIVSAGAFYIANTTEEHPFLSFRGWVGVAVSLMTVAGAGMSESMAMKRKSVAQVANEEEAEAAKNSEPEPETNKDVSLDQI